MINHFKFKGLKVSVTLSNLEMAFVFKHELHGPTGSKTAIAFIETSAHIGHRACVVVCGCLHQNCNAVRRIALKDDFLVISLILGRGTLDGALNIVFRHVGVSRILNQGLQSAVAFRIWSTLLDAHDDVLRNPGERLSHASPSLHFASFPVLKCSSHVCLFLLLKPCYLNLPDSTCMQNHL